MIVNFKIIIFLLISSTAFTQSKIDSVLVYSSSLDFYMGIDPFSYTVLKYPREVDPIVIKNMDTLSMIDLTLSKLEKRDSTKAFFVYFLTEIYRGKEKEILVFNDKKQISYKGVKYKKDKHFYDFFIGVIENKYNTIMPIE